jgi:hypothetical protein
MIRMNSINLALAVGAVAVATTGCGRLIERATEEAVEQAIESDSGEEVEIDFSDGEIRVESAEGDITFSADEDGIQIDGTDADGNDFSVDADENGLEVQSEDGTSLDIDEDGTFVATDENGEVITGEADGDGGFTVEGSDGEAVFSSSDEIPEQWPSDVPEPDGLSDVTGTYFSEGDDQSIIVTGTVSGDLRDAFDGYTSQLEDAGFEEESTFTQGDDAANSTYVRGEQRISVSIQSLGGTSEMVIALN